MVAKTRAKKTTTRKNPVVEDEYVEIHWALPKVRKRVFTRIGKKLGALDVRLYRKLRGWSRNKDLED